MAKQTKQLVALREGGIKVLGDIPVAVLSNRDRVVSIRGMAYALGVRGGGTYWRQKKDDPNVAALPEFISAKNLQPYVTEIIPELLDATVPYTALNGQEAVGIKAEFIPKILEVWLKALHDGNLTEKQKKVAQQSRILLSAAAGIGFVALIDEATGFQKDKEEYERLMAKYIAPELQPWVKTFGDDYYYQIYRLKGWDWNRYALDKKNHPWAVANITNRIVYEKLPDGIVEALKDKEPADAKGNRKHRLHQHLTPEEGKVHLLKLMGAVGNIMEQYDDGHWEEALHAIDTRFPSKRIGPQLALEFGPANPRIFQGLLNTAATPEPKETKTSD